MRFAMVAALFLKAAAAATSKVPPNFVIMMVDDWGWGDLGANWPAAKGMTPHMDAMASEGVRFTDFHVGASVCSVSRAALLTGRLGVRNGVVHNFAVNSMYGLPRTEKTIAELLKPAGYRTGIIGKWHLGTTPGFHPSYRGFDHYLGLPYSVDMGCTDMGGYDKGGARVCRMSQGPTDHAWQLPLPLYASTTNCSDQTTGTCNGDIVQSPVNFTTLSDRYSSFAEEFIGNVSQDKSPFFLYVPFSHIHTPQYTATRNKGKSGKTGDAGHFYDTLLEVDETVGNIMSSLKSAGVDDNTLVFLTGDNGPWEIKCQLSGSPGPHTGLWQKNEGGGGSSSKCTLFEGGHREVGLARWPGHISPRVSNALASSLDFLPTILSIAGIPLPTDRVFDGIDLSDVLMGGSDSKGHVTLFHPNSGQKGSIDGKLDGIRWNQWKAIYQTGGVPDCSGNEGNITRHDPPLLFDLSADPAEAHALDTTNPKYAAVVKSMVGLLAEQMHSVNTTMNSVVNYSVLLSSEPCVNYPKSCRSGGGGPTPPPPPPGPAPPPSPGKGKCTFENDTGFEKGQQVPGHRNDPASTAQDCCNLCAGIQGCSGAAWTNGQCYYKTKKEMKPRPLKGVTAVFGTWAPTPPAPPGPKPPRPPPPPTPPPGPAPPATPQPTPAPLAPPPCTPGNKPVQVFILMGQSNMLGEGKKAGTTVGSLQYAVETEHKYQYLWNKSTGTWSTSKNVRNVFVMGSGGGPTSPDGSAKVTLQNNEWMTGGPYPKPLGLPGMITTSKSTIGPELGIGFALGNYTSEPIMTLKSCIGDRALGWDLLPPGSTRVNYTDSSNQSWTYAGYHDTPEKWMTGTQPIAKPWYAGVQYDGDITRANLVLGNLSTFYPGAKCYEVAGFFWWQGDRDSRDMGLSTNYERNLVTLIKQLRVQYGSPNAKFVTASLGQTKQGDRDGGGLILDAMENVANPTKYPEFKDNVAVVYTHPLLHTPGSSGAHYGRDAETYMNVGQAMGAAMVRLLKLGAP